MKPNRTKHSANWMRRKNKIKEITLRAARGKKRHTLNVYILCARWIVSSLSRIETLKWHSENTNTQPNYTYAYTVIHSNSYPTRTRRGIPKKKWQRLRQQQKKQRAKHTEGKTNKIKSYRTKKKLNWNAHIPKAPWNTNVSIHIALARTLQLSLLKHTRHTHSKPKQPAEAAKWQKGQIRRARVRERATKRKGKNKSKLKSSKRITHNKYGIART